jgi:3-hydroxybutyryl-CoA dehydratase
LKQKVAKKPNIFFEDLELNQSASFTEKISAVSIDKFVEISGDSSAIHVDELMAIQRGFSGRVVHGAYLNAKLSRLIGTELPGHNSLLLNLALSFKSPVLVGDVVTFKVDVVEIHQSVGCVGLKLIVLNSKHKAVCNGKALVKVERSALKS